MPTVDERLTGKRNPPAAPPGRPRSCVAIVPSWPRRWRARSVFAVEASSQPLPPYYAWRAGLAASPWGKFESPPGVVWVDDGVEIQALTAEDAPGQRGKEKAVRAVGFAVLPKKGL